MIDRRSTVVGTDASSCEEAGVFVVRERDHAVHVFAERSGGAIADGWIFGQGAEPDGEEGWGFAPQPLSIEDLDGSSGRRIRVDPPAQQSERGDGRPLVVAPDGCRDFAVIDAIGKGSAR